MPAVNVTPLGNVPVRVIRAAGEPVVVMANVKAETDLGGRRCGAGERRGAPTLSVNAWVVVPAELVAVNVIRNVRPTIAAVGVPDNFAVPSAAARNVTPVGNVPVRVRSRPENRSS